eukprot:9034189-Pyramimonas_sp.AAC.1
MMMRMSLRGCDDADVDEADDRRAREARYNPRLRGEAGRRARRWIRIEGYIATFSHIDINI